MYRVLCDNQFNNEHSNHDNLPLQDFSRITLSLKPKIDGLWSREKRRNFLRKIGYGRKVTYSKLQKLGEGTYSIVFKGKSILTSKFVALKEIKLNNNEGIPCSAIREISILKELKHNNIVTLHDIVITKMSLTLVFEYMEKDLKQYLEECNNFQCMNNVKIFLFQILRGLNYCQKKSILHRDLKPQNLLVNIRGEIKLADFGLSRIKSIPTKMYSNQVVTLWYRPPDVLLGSKEYNISIDMWSVGCIFFEITSGKPLFPGSSIDNELNLIFSILGTPRGKYCEKFTNKKIDIYKFPYYKPIPFINLIPRLANEGLDLLSKFLKFHPNERISAYDALSHSYFYSLGKQVHNLSETASIYSAHGIQFCWNH